MRSSAVRMVKPRTQNAVDPSGNGNLDGTLSERPHKSGKKRPRSEGQRSLESKAFDEKESALSALIFGSLGGSGEQKYGLEQTHVVHADAEEEEQQEHVPEKQRKGRKQKKKAKEVASVAWEDEDDEAVTVDISARPRLRKLRETESDDEMPGTEFQTRLRKRFVASNVGQEWATQTAPPSGYADDSDNERDADVKKLLASSARMLGTGSGLLQPGYINIVRLKDANQQDPSSSTVQSVCFDSSGELLVTAGFDKTLRIFQVDGAKNKKLHGIHFKDLPIHRAAFTADDQVVVAGARPYFYWYDIRAGAVHKVPRIFSAGGAKQPSLKIFAASPDGEWLVFAGTAGYIMLVSNRTKQWAADFKLNCNAMAVCFSPDSGSVIASGADGEVYRFDIRSQRCLYRFFNEGGTATTSLAAGRSYTAVGSASGVVNIYDSNAVASAGLRPRPLHAIMNLTTPVTTAKFSFDDQILAIASAEKRDSLKLVHMPSGTVFSNWPTERTPIRYPFSFDFSQSGTHFAIGNDRGSVLLYQLQHYAKT